MPSPAVLVLLRTGVPHEHQTAHLAATDCLPTAFLECVFFFSDFCHITFGVHLSHTQIYRCKLINKTHYMDIAIKYFFCIS
jgi:hypothetical protein